METPITPVLQLRRCSFLFSCLYLVILNYFQTRVDVIFKPDSQFSILVVTNCLVQEQSRCILGDIVCIRYFAHAQLLKSSEIGHWC